MAIVILQLPNVKRKTETRPKKCPYCPGETFQRWGRVRKAVRDSRFRSVRVYRYRCCLCHRTFRHYPEGVDRADQTERLRKLAAICWVLGLSLRGVVQVLSAFGIPLCHMTVWRDMDEANQKLSRRRRWKQVRVLGLDGAYVLCQGKKQAVLVAVDMGDGRPVAIGHVDESNPQAVRRFLGPIVKDLNVSVIVTDDLASFRLVAEKLDVEHQVCQFHLRRWVGKALRQLRETVPKEWRWVLEEIKHLIEELPPEGSRHLFELWKQIPERRTLSSGSLSPLGQLRNLLIRLSEHWPSYRVFTWQKDVPWTNNITEQAIGRMKMRSRTVRGYKSWPGMHQGLMLAGSGVGI
jgi:transposase-like protein